MRSDLIIFRHKNFVMHITPTVLTTSRPPLLQLSSTFKLTCFFNILSFNFQLPHVEITLYADKFLLKMFNLAGL